MNGSLHNTIAIQKMIDYWTFAIKKQNQENTESMNEMYEAQNDTFKVQNVTLWEHNWRSDDETTWQVFSR